MADPAIDTLLARNLLKLADRNLAAHEYAKAAAAATEARDLYQQAADPRYAPSLALAVTTAAAAHAQLGESNEAVAGQRRARELLDGIASASGGDLPADDNLAATLSLLGPLQIRLGLPREALRTADNGVAMAANPGYRSLPSTRRSGPAVFWLVRGAALLTLGRAEDAINAVEQSLINATERDTARLRELGLPVLSGAAEQLAGQGSTSGMLPVIGRLTDQILARPVADEAATESDPAVDLYRRMAEYSPDSARPALASVLQSRAAHLAEQGEFDAALAAAAEAVEVNRALAGVNPKIYAPHLARAMDLHATLAKDIAQERGDRELLGSAIAELRSAVDVLPFDSDDRAALLADLVEARLTLALWTNDHREVDLAVTETRAVVDSAPRHTRSWVGALSVLAQALLSRFDYTGDPGDIDEAINASRQALDSSEPEDPAREALLSTLAGALQARQAMTGSLSDLDEAAETLREATKFAPSAGPLQFQLGSVLMSRYQLTGNRIDLDNVIASYRQALDTTPDSDARTKAVILGNLAQGLAARGRAAASDPHGLADRGLADLNEAVDAARQSMTLTPDQSPGALTSRYLLASTLYERFQAQGDATDLSEAIRAMRDVASDAPDASEDRTYALGNLAMMLHAEFTLSGNASSRDAAIAVAGEVLSRTTAGDPIRDDVLEIRSDLLESRYQRHGDMSDLAEAIAGWRSLAADGSGSPRTSRILLRLSNALRVCYTRNQNTIDLDDAIRAAVQVTAATADDPVLRAESLCAQAEALLTRFTYNGDPSDLNRAIELTRNAIAITSDDSPVLSRCRSVLASGLAARIDRGADTIDRVSWLANRFDQTGHESDLAEALTALRSVAESPEETALGRIKAAHQFGRLAMSSNQLDRALAGFQIAIEQLPRLLSDRIWRESQLLDQASLTELVSDAAACAIEAGRPERAVELLEQGRIVLLSQALGAQDELAPVRKLAPDMAGRLLEIRAFLDDPTSKQRGLSSAHTLESEFDELIMRIRALPGLQRFAMRPDVGNVSIQAELGPIVIINISDYRCDALALTPGSKTVKVIALPGLAREHVISQARSFQEALAPDYRPMRDRLEREKVVTDILAWLWDTVADPVLTSLDLRHRPASGTPMPRLWWIPTGPMTLFPLHAAGRNANVLDYVVSSYTVSITALEVARTIAAPAAAAGSRLVILPPHTAMPGAEREAYAIAERLSARLLGGEEATRERVLVELPEAQILHFAGHGEFNSTNPTACTLLLSDSKLSPEELHFRAGPQPQLAFLSACKSAQTLPDETGEAVNLGMILQQAGYRHTISTLWEVNDRTFADIAQDFYSQITADGVNVDESAFALHKAVSRFRERYPHIPSLWATHIHVGP